MTYTNNNSVSTFHVINKNGKLFVRHSFVGINTVSTGDMMIYGIGNKPYIKRMGKKIFLTDDLLAEI